MMNRHDASSAAPIHPSSPFHAVILVCFVAAFSYLAARLGGALVLRPEMIWPVWPGCAFLVAVLLLTPRKIWPVLLIAGLGAFALYDAQEHLPIRATVLLLLSDSIEILVAALGVSYVFGGVPRLNSVKSLAKYSLFAVILAPTAVASTAAAAFETDSWWIAFFTEALALLTLTPAILSWVDIAIRRGNKLKLRQLEAVLMLVGLTILLHLTLVAPGREGQPALLYSLVPFLLWAALRFGITGVSNSIVLVAFLTVWGVVRGHGPFIGDTPAHDVLSLQLFLLVAGSSFMVLAAVVEDHKAAVHTVRKSEEGLRTSEERLRLAQQAARIGSFEWNIQTGVESWTSELEAIYGLSPGSFGGTHTRWENLIHPNDLAEVLQSVDEALKTGQPMTGEWRVVWPDGSIHWVAGRWQVLANDSGEPSRVVGVNMDVTERKQAEEVLLAMNRGLEAQAAELQSREELLKIFIKNVPAGVAMLDREMRYLQVSDRWCADYGVDASHIIGRSHYEIFSDVPQRWKEMHRRALNGETLRADEDQWVREGGSTTWVRWEIRPWRNPAGIIGGILIFAEDITQRQQMQEALSGMSRKLIESQEQERARIGRELHDDINQKLAMLAVELEQLGDDPSMLRNGVKGIREKAVQISNDVQALSHELHSSKIEYLGVVAGMKSWCKEFGGHQKMEVVFSSDAPSPIRLEIGLPLFRVLQEALHNAVKHSGVKRVEVQLKESLNEVHLIVSDSGTGFNVEEATHGTGLGLTSMQERARLVGGTIAIESKPMAGTTIHVRVPLKSEKFFERAVG